MDICQDLAENCIRILHRKSYRLLTENCTFIYSINASKTDAPHQQKQASGGEGGEAT